TPARLADPTCLRWLRRPCGRQTRPGRNSDSRSEFLDFRKDRFRIRRHLRVFGDPLVSDHAAEVEDEHGSLGDALQAEAPEAIVLDPVGLADGPVPIPEQRIVEAVLLLEDPMTVMAVRSDAYHLRPHRLKAAEGAARAAQ